MAQFNHADGGEATRPEAALYGPEQWGDGKPWGATLTAICPDYPVLLLIKGESYRLLVLTSSNNKL